MISRIELYKSPILLRHAGKMAEDLQNPTWKYFVIHHTALLDVRPNRDGESTFWQQREHKNKKRERERSVPSAIMII